MNKGEEQSESERGTKREKGERGVVRENEKDNEEDEKRNRFGRKMLGDRERYGDS